MPRAAYFYKPKGNSKYPERVYIFLNWECWNTRNLFPMGLANANPFLERDMTEWELEFVKPNHRLVYLQYENWEKVFSDDESMDLPESHFEKLLIAQKNFKLPPKKVKLNIKKNSQIELSL